MNDFEKTLEKFVEEADLIKKREALLKIDQATFGEKLFSFLKEQGLPENFTIPELAMLAIRKSKSVIHSV